MELIHRNQTYLILPWRRLLKTVEPHPGRRSEARTQQRTQSVNQLRP